MLFNFNLGFYMKSIACNDTRYVNLLRELNTSCFKLSKYFFSLPVLLCRITCHMNSFSVHILLNTNGKAFSGVGYGISSSACIEHAIQNILRNMEKGGSISLLRGDRVLLPKILLQCRE